MLQPQVERGGGGSGYLYLLYRITLSYFLFYERISLLSWSDNRWKLSIDFRRVSTKGEKFKTEVQSFFIALIELPQAHAYAGLN